MNVVLKLEKAFVLDFQFGCVDWRPFERQMLVDESALGDSTSADKFGCFEMQMGWPLHYWVVRYHWMKLTM